MRAGSGTYYFAIMKQVDTGAILLATTTDKKTEIAALDQKGGGEVNVPFVLSPPR